MLDRDPREEEAFLKNAISAPVRVLVGFCFFLLLFVLLVTVALVSPLVENIEDLFGLLMLIFFVYIMGWITFVGKVPDWVMGTLINRHKKP